MKRYGRNTLVFAENNGNQGGFNVYLEFSGKREYIFTHRHNGAMYNMLKDGFCIGDLKRGIRDMNLPLLSRNRISVFDTEQLWNSMRYLMVVIDEYIGYREECA